jgi:hypothetical protein
MLSPTRTLLNHISPPSNGSRSHHPRASPTISTGKRPQPTEGKPPPSRQVPCKLNLPLATDPLIRDGKRGYRYEEGPRTLPTSRHFSVCSPP